MQPIPVGNQPIPVGNQGAGIRFRGGRCYPAAAISPSRSSIPRAAMPMQPIRVGNQPNLDGNQGAGIRFRGGRCYPAAAISPSLTAYQPIRVVNPAGCYADAAHPAAAISPTLTATRARESGFGGGGAAIPRRQSAHP